jgi:hypothetical protein
MMKSMEAKTKWESISSAVRGYGKWCLYLGIHSEDIEGVLNAAPCLREMDRGKAISFILDGED